MLKRTHKLQDTQRADWDFSKLAEYLGRTLPRGNMFGIFKDG